MKEKEDKVLSRKLKINADAKPNGLLSYIEEPAVLESSNGNRLILGLTAQIFINENMDLETYVYADLEDFRVAEFVIDNNLPPKFDSDSGTGVFTSRGNQYKIRALQEYDKSWVNNLDFTKDTNEIRVTNGE
jgi:hypothetical protein